jgi:hypothetical protein
MIFGTEYKHQEYNKKKVATKKKKKKNRHLALNNAKWRLKTPII